MAIEGDYRRARDCTGGRLRGLYGTGRRFYARFTGGALDSSGASMEPIASPRPTAEAQPRGPAHPRATPAALAVIVAALSLVGVFFVMVLARLAVMLVHAPAVAHSLRRIAAALGIGS